MIKTIVTKTGVTKIEMSAEEEAAFFLGQESQRILNLTDELDRLELATAKGFLWLVKKLIAADVIQTSDLPPKLIAYKDRIEEIEGELGN